MIETKKGWFYMKRDPNFAPEKGLAYCGLACCLCSENANCAGCRNAGCTGKDSCRIYRCCKEKGIAGCWECQAFPCDARMFTNPRVRAFVRFAAAHGEEKLLDVLAANVEKGLVYHYPNKLVGDYDLQSEEAILQLLEK
jgi:hypothetical protein